MNICGNIREVIGGIEIPDSIKYLGQPDWEDVNLVASSDLTSYKLYLEKEKDICIRYSGIIKKLKLRCAREGLMKLQLIKYLETRDKIINKKNKLIKSQNIYRHDLDLNDFKNIVFIYESQKGAKRFPSKICYEFFIQTGREPYEIS